MGKYAPLGSRQLGDKELMLVTLARHAGASPLTANTTTTINIPTPAVAGAVLISAAVSASTVAADADGTILATLVKRTASDDGDDTISSSADLEALTAKEKTEFTLSNALEHRTFAIADTLELDVVNNSAAIDTQPVDLVVTCVFAVTSV